MTRKFLIVCQARTGSTALLTALRQHKQIAAHGEVYGGNMKAGVNIFGVKGNLKPPITEFLRDYRNANPIGFWDDVLMRESAYRATGFKFKYEEMQLKQWSKLIDHVIQDKSVHIISLKRDNLLERELSEYIALNVTKIFNTRDSQHSQADIKVILDPKKLEEGFAKSKKWQEKHLKLFAKHPILHLKYNDVSMEGAATFKKVQEFLNVDFQDITALTKKLQKKPLHETIQNYEELKAYFKKSEYKNFFV